jgi:ubiquinone biosynthesis protein COQ9
MGEALTRLERQDRIFEAALNHVPFDGWSRKSLLAGAADAGFDAATARRLFPSGGDDLLAHLDFWADRQMLARLDGLDLGSMRMRERVAAAVRARLEALAPYHEAVRRAASAYALPNNAVRASRRLWRTVDTIWHAVGDTGGGLGYYTKRGLLAAVYSSTLLYWLEDRSEDFEDTWSFLERRIDDVMRIGKVRSGIENALDGLGALNPLRRH